MSGVGARERPSPNHDARPPPGRVGLVVLHYTGMRDRDGALARLADPAAGVSCHWLVDEEGGVFRMVPEERRAWHAGEGSWGPWTDVNAVSVGIELVNPGHEFGYRPFPEAQVAALEALLGEVCARHGVGPEGVVGHSDVAPLRKRDPGELFPWRRLAARGLAVWPEAGGSAPEGTLRRGDRGAEVRALQGALRAFGYGLAVDGVFGDATRAVVEAFQRRFRPERVDGDADGATRALAGALAGGPPEAAREGG